MVLYNANCTVLHGLHGQIKGSSSSLCTKVELEMHCTNRFQISVYMECKLGGRLCTNNKFSPLDPIHECAVEMTAKGVRRLWKAQKNISRYKAAKELEAS